MFSSASPRAVARLASRIQKEVPRAQVCGIVYEQGSSFAGIGRLPTLSGLLSAVGSALLRFVHACPANPNGPTQYGQQELATSCRAFGRPLLVVGDIGSPETLPFVQGQGADLGIVYGPRVCSLDVFHLPWQGSITLRIDNADDGSGDLFDGLKIMSGRHPEIRLSVHRLRKQTNGNDALCTATVPVEQFDTATSVALKSQLVGADLLVQSVADFAERTLGKTAQETTGPPSRTGAPGNRMGDHGVVAFPRVKYSAKRGRPAWKLVVRLTLLPWVILRNWIRRLRKRFPITVLYHHLVADRPHRMGIPTDLFLKHVRFLQKHYKIASLSEAIEMLKANSLPAPTVVLTFDDGYQDNFINLRAVAEAAGVPVSIFVCTDYVTNRQELPHDLRQGERNFRLLTWEQVAFLGRNGIEIGSHTRSHFDCGSSDPAALQREIVGSKTDLERHLGHPIKFFSFPWGHPRNMSSAAVKLAKQTYAGVLSSLGGTESPTPNDTVWHLRRRSYSNDLFELELLLQEVLEFGREEFSSLPD